MWPGAAVSGLYFSHPQSQYFVLGRVGRDQVEDYAAPQGLDGRRGREVALAEPRLPDGGRVKDPAAPHHSQARPGTLRPGPFQHVAAVLFDMDGTLVETEQYWDQALVELGAGWGGRSARGAGRDRRGRPGRRHGHLRTPIGVTRTPARGRRRPRLACWPGWGSCMAGSSSWQPGARELLLACLAGRRTHRAGHHHPARRWSPRAAAPARRPGRRPVRGHGVRGRGAGPQAGPGALPAGHGGAGPDPAECVVVEDSLTGSRAGLAAGCRVLAVPSGQALPPEPGLTVRRDPGGGHPGSPGRAAPSGPGLTGCPDRRRRGAVVRQPAAAAASAGNGGGVPPKDGQNAWWSHQPHSRLLVGPEVTGLDRRARWPPRSPAGCARSAAARPRRGRR